MVLNTVASLKSRAALSNFSLAEELYSTGLEIDAENVDILAALAKLSLLMKNEALGPDEAARRERDRANFQAWEFFRYAFVGSCPKCASSDSALFDGEDLPTMARALRDEGKSPLLPQFENFRFHPPA